MKEALKLALEALESTVYWRTTGIGRPPEQTAMDAITTIKEALAQPEQELLAWKNAALRVGEDLSSVRPNGYYNMTAQQWLDWAMAQQPRGKNFLAQQRTWVGLTDVEWMNIVNKDHAWFGQRPENVAHEVAKLVEAKLKEKNI